MIATNSFESTALPLHGGEQPQHLFPYSQRGFPLIFDFNIQFINLIQHTIWIPFYVTLVIYLFVVVGVRSVLRRASALTPEKQFLLWAFCKLFYKSMIWKIIICVNIWTY